ncbi:FAD-dependent pyridine nucleotide-disulfide oxidoreductase [Paraburkholderia atlantica]|uniref:FAD-dependent pyridine nucleotide-disulfide oxidoreductase n=1 Tax=Paraburkholderia atlantica TaxID=2654982 RepID=D5WHG1_PARAM|nr:FAD-dependent oxidoreductase [Paraburkholderia atlantica]ADG17906.1 FAD-dependent pyridine nucleotide-disulfide oxidoreductase [Paraburkholderia atlantica]
MSTTARRVARLSELPADRAVRVTVDDTPILLVRDGDTVRAYSPDCPHAGGPLEEGALCHGRIICPWHKGTFDVATGNVLEPPPLLPLDRYPVTLDGDDVLVSAEKIAVPAQAGHTPPLDATAQREHYVVIGAGAAGAAACAALREFGFEGRITLIGDEAHAPYDRTSLSKFVPSFEMPPADVPPLLPPDWLHTHGIERIVAKVARLDVPARTIHFETGAGNSEQSIEPLKYDTALLATGSVPKVPDIPGCELGGVHVLRHLDDAAALIDALGDDASQTRVAILGSSFIGLEVASALRKHGVPVTVISRDKVPFAKQFGERAGQMFRALHESNGVKFYLDAKVASLEGEEGNVHTVMLDGGEAIAADVVLLGTGVAPATGFVEGLPLQKDGGVVVNAGMSAACGLYAAGDIAVFSLHENQEPLRIEHWRVAQQHARIAAQNMCGVRTRYADVPFFWTYHYGKNFEYLGHASQWDEIVVDGDFDHHQFIALYVRDDNVDAVFACEREALTARLSDAMRGGLSRADALAIIGATAGSAPQAAAS